MPALIVTATTPFWGRSYWAGLAGDDECLLSICVTSDNLWKQIPFYTMCSTIADFDLILTIKWLTITSPPF